MSRSPKQQLISKRNKLNLKLKSAENNLFQVLNDINNISVATHYNYKNYVLHLISSLEDLVKSSIKTELRFIEESKILDNSAVK